MLSYSEEIVGQYCSETVCRHECAQLRNNAAIKLSWSGKTETAVWQFRLQGGCEKNVYILAQIAICASCDTCIL